MGAQLARLRAVRATLKSACTPGFICPF
jgi:hypothetical protein